MFLFPRVNQGPANTGFKYLKNYSPADYESSPQNWSVTQDKRGIIYAANQLGLLEFDGGAWRAIIMPNTSVRSLARDDSGRIYVGGVNQLGVMTPTSNGKVEYISLVHHIHEDKRNFATVWRTHVTGNGVYFRTSKYLFRWDPNTGNMKQWQPKNRINASFVCNGKYYIHQRKAGLLQVVEDSLQLVAGGEAFAGVKIYMIAPYDSQKLLIGTRSNGFYIYTGDSAVPFPTEADDYIKKINSTMESN